MAQHHTINAFAVGMPIYYTGDVANLPANGVITAIRPANRWGGESLDIQLVDGREIRGIYPSMFDKTPGQRFHILTEWQAERAEKIEQMRREFLAVAERARQAVR